jgi:ABC-type phosphate transport system substrate-binding protein
MSFRRALVAGVAAVVALAATTARAQTTCGSTMPTVAGGTFTATPIYITGSSALAPFLNSIGAKLATLPTNPYVIIYNNAGGSCVGVNRINTDGMIATGTTMTYVPQDASSAKPTLTCTIGAGGQLGDLVLSDVDATLCPGITAQPAGTMDFHGPVNNMVFIVPSTSTQQAISAEEAYLVFGLGMAGMVDPWTDPTAYFIRTKDSGTRAMITANIGTGTHPWQGQDGTANGGTAFGSGDVVKKVAGNAMTAAEKTIGILGSDVYDSGNNRSSVKALAFRAFKQHYAYWPDSTVGAIDRKNVREGRYPIWGYVHMIASVTNGTPNSAAAQYFIQFIQGKLPAASAPSFNIIDALIAAHVTPTCAMKVTHDIEGGAQKPYTDPAPCGCYFDARTASPAMPLGCTQCKDDSTCNGGKCRNSYCEAQ